MTNLGLMNTSITQEVKTKSLLRNISCFQHSGLIHFKNTCVKIMAFKKESKFLRPQICLLSFFFIGETNCNNYVDRFLAFFDHLSTSLLIRGISHPLTIEFIRVIEFIFQVEEKGALKNSHQRLWRMGLQLLLFRGSFN